MEYFIFHRASCQEDYINLLGDKKAMQDTMLRPIKRFVQRCLDVHEANAAFSPFVIVAMQLLMRPGFFVDRQMITNVDTGTSSKKEFQELFNICGNLCLEYPLTSANLKPFEEALQNWNQRTILKARVLPGTQEIIEKLNKTILLCINILQLKTSLFEIIKLETMEQTYSMLAEQHWFLDAHAVADLDLIGDQEMTHQVYRTINLATEHVLQVLLSQNHLNATLGKATPDGNCGYESIAHHFNAMISGIFINTTSKKLIVNSRCQ